MQKHTVDLTDKEFRLFQLIQQIQKTDETTGRKDDLIEIFIRQLELFYETDSYKQKKKWLRNGDKSFFKTVSPVVPGKDSPLASDIIIEQRKHLAEK